MVKLSSLLFYHINFHDINSNFRFQTLLKYRICSLFIQISELKGLNPGVIILNDLINVTSISNAKSRVANKSIHIKLVRGSPRYQFQYTNCRYEAQLLICIRQILDEIQTHIRTLTPSVTQPTCLSRLNAIEITYSYSHII